MKFNLYNCDVGFKINGVNYEFEHVNSVAIEDPEFSRLTRGANGKNKVGLAYKEGLKEPKTITVVINDMSADLKAVLDGCFENQTRIDFYAIDRGTGSAKWAKNSILGQIPQQLTLDESPESMDVSLTLQSYDLSEVFKA